MAQSNLTLSNDGPIAVIEFQPDSFAQAIAVEQTARELYAAVEQGAAKKIVIDFAKVNFLSSQGLGALLTLRLKAAKVGATLVLANVRARFGEILALTNLDKLFTILDSREAALQHLRSGN